MTTTPVAELAIEPPTEASPGEAPWRGAVVVGVAALITPVGYLGNEGVSPLVALGGLLTLPWLFAPLRRPPLGAWLLLALAAWAAASYAWSPVETQQLARLHSYNGLQALVAPKLFVQLLLYGALLDGARRLSPVWRRRALWVLTVTTAATLALLVVEGFDGGTLYGRLSDLVGRHWPPDLQKRNAARGCYGAVVLIWPCAAVLWRREWGAGAVAAIVAGMVSALLLGVDAPVAATLAALGAFFVVSRLGRAGVWACLAATLVYLIATPALFLNGRTSGASLPTDVGKLSWHVRLDVWRFASGKVIQRPLAGWGLDSSRAWPDDIPMHPHDASIQLWLETGVVGVALSCAFWAWLFWRIAAAEREDRNAAAVMAATAAAYLVIGAISFGVWQEWWLAYGAFAIAACAMLAAARREETRDWGETELVELT